MPIATCLIITLLSSAAVPALIRSSDPESIVSVRRFSGLLFVSNLIWLFPLIVGSIGSSLGNFHSNSSGFVFGAFLAWGFQLIIINGAFLKSTWASLTIAAVQPISVLFAVTSFHPDVIAIPFALLALMACLIFPYRVDKVRTNTGTSSLDMLRAFLKTWVSSKPSDLEGFFMSYSKREPVETTVLISSTKRRKTVFVLPGIHPGPFSPVGSYNLSELIYQDLKKDGIIPVVLHGTGGHERNVPMNKLATDYAREVSQFVASQEDQGLDMMRGPVRYKVGTTNLTILGFGKEMFTIVTNAPYRSDDLDPKAITSASEAAMELGLDVLTVDAHNSVNGQDITQEVITRDQWKKVLSDTLGSKEMHFKVGSANSSELGFKVGGDVSDGGISVTIFATAEGKNVLVNADSNNAVSGLREKLASEISAMGMSMIDLCTSDTHKLAARNLTERGYFALGEYTKPEVVIILVKKLIMLADSRLQPSYVLVTKLRSEVSLIGSESLDNFASLTKRAIALSKSYVKIVAPILLMLLAVTLFY